MPSIRETNWNLIVEGDELKEVASPRVKEFIEIKVDNSQIDYYLNNGWNVKKSNKKTSILKKDKKIGDAFEDEVWSIFYKMGFKHMNKADENGTKFSVVYSPENNLSKQIDVVAIDDEVCLLIECKESHQYGTRRNFQMDINEVPSFYRKVCNTIRTKYPDVKFKYIFATKNVNVGQQDKNRMSENDIIHFDYATVLYYKALVEHLGSAAKYQLLGQIFAGQKISNMDVEIPAVRGKMGPYTYYSFIMKPEQLLKISYVLHKTNANNEYEELLPSYQRLIKKDRLQKVREFIDNKGFFPNSIVISVDTKRDLQFDLAPNHFNQDRLMKMGVLHLPQVYQSAYIIDGQHRLYGYSGSTHSEDNSIPVVAFVNLDKKEQLKLFMEINMNQKAVPKALKNILEIDVYYDSQDPKLAQSALLGKIAKHLGEDSQSSLKERVVIGEDATTKRCCITIENLKLAFEKSCFFNKLRRNGELVTNGEGFLNKSSNDETFACAYPLIKKFFNTIREEFIDEWDSDDNFFVKNNTIGGLIRIFSDMVLIKYGDDRTKADDEVSFWSGLDDFMADLLLVLRDLTPEERLSITKPAGAGAPGIAHRVLQMKMFEFDSSFRNADIEEYYETTYKNYNEDAKPEIVKIKNVLLEKIGEVFTEQNWMRLHLSEEHENDLTSRVNAKNNANERNGINQRITEWDEMNFQDISKIINHGSNWSEYFKEIFVKWLPDCNKNSVSLTIMTIKKCSDSIKNGHKINGTDFKEIHNLYKAMIEA